jgi:hypothetical protein
MTEFPDTWHLYNNPLLSLQPTVADQREAVRQEGSRRSEIKATVAGGITVTWVSMAPSVAHRDNEPMRLPLFRLGPRRTDGTGRRRARAKCRCSICGSAGASRSSERHRARDAKTRVAGRGPDWTGAWESARGLPLHAAPAPSLCSNGALMGASHGHSPKARPVLRNRQ